MDILMMLILPIHQHSMYLLIGDITYLYLLQFLSSVSYNFPSTGLLHPWLNLFLGTSFFIAIVNGIVFLVSLIVHYWCIEMPWSFPSGHSHQVSQDGCLQVHPGAVKEAAVLCDVLSSQVHCWHIASSLRSTGPPSR